MQNKHQEVQNYYGEQLKTNEDLQTNACCTLSPPPQFIQDIIKEIHDEVMSKYYGCGLTIPYKLKGMKILDLGSGSGRDCYIASKLVGQRGEVVGIDMTKEQLDVSNKHIDYHTKVFGFDYSNVKFLKGNIEELDKLELKEKSFDIIISNCVINLAKDKEKVLKDAYRLLKPGGEMYFSDVYADRRIPMEYQDDPLMWGECLSGALYWNDFLNLAKIAGFKDPRSVESRPIAIENEELSNKLDPIQFFSVTYRLFKLDKLESDCEDYGQAVKYKGTIKNSEKVFKLDDHHIFEKGKIMSVCGNTHLMLADTRFKDDFEFYGDFSMHYGIFEGCGGAMPFNQGDSQADPSCC